MKSLKVFAPLKALFGSPEVEAIHNDMVGVMIDNARIATYNKAFNSMKRAKSLEEAFQNLCFAYDSEFPAKKDTA